MLRFPLYTSRDSYGRQKHKARFNHLPGYLLDSKAICDLTPGEGGFDLRGDVQECPAGQDIESQLFAKRVYCGLLSRRPTNFNRLEPYVGGAGASQFKRVVTRLVQKLDSRLCDVATRGAPSLTKNNSPC